MRLLVTRPQEDAERFVAALQAAGHAAVVAPLLEVEIRRETPDFAGVQALLFTSANGVRAFAANSARRDLPALCVGDRTAALAGEAGFGEVRSAAGDVQALAALVRAERDPAAGALLHVAGSRVAGDLAGALEAAGFAVRRLALYSARPVAALPEAARRALLQGRLDGVGFFSPRTAASFVRLVRAAGLAHTTETLTAFCLSPAVAETLRGLAWRHVQVAQAPTQAALLAEIGGSQAAADAPASGRETAGEERIMAEDGESSRTPQDAEAGPNDDGESPRGSVAETVIARFGGLRPTATKLGVAVSTVQGWKARGHIPPTRHEEVLKAAATHGIDLSDLDLAAGAEEAPPPTGAAPGEPVLAEAVDESRPPEPAEEPGDEATAAARAGAETPVTPWGSSAGERRTETAAPGAPGARDDAAAAEPGPAEPAPPPSALPPPPPKGGAGGFLLGLVLAIVLFAGGAVAAAFTRDIWEAYLPPPADDPAQAEIASLRDRLAALEDAPAPLDPQRVRQVESRLATLSNRVTELAGQVQQMPTATADAADAAGASGALRQAVSELQAQVAELATRPAPEAPPAAPPTAPTVDPAAVTGLQEQVAGLQEALEGLRDRLPDPGAEAAAAETVAGLQQQLGELSGRLEQVSERAQQAVAAQAGDSGFALALGQLRDALRFSDPFATELQAVRGLMPADDPLRDLLQPLQAHAESGVPTRDELAVRFEPVAREVVAASYDESWSGRLMSRISQAVSVRPVGEVEGESARARIARADADLAREDLAGAAGELRGLSGEAAAAAEAWLADAEARLAAEQALGALTRRTLERLTPAPAAAAASE